MMIFFKKDRLLNHDPPGKHDVIQLHRAGSALRFEAWHLVFGHALVDLRGGGDAEDTKCRGFSGMMMMIIIVINNDIYISVIRYNHIFIFIYDYSISN
jgi:hypothetical protein